VAYKKETISPTPILSAIISLPPSIITHKRVMVKHNPKSDAWGEDIAFG
jgi:hypothetical protein